MRRRGGFGFIPFIFLFLFIGAGPAIGISYILFDFLPIIFIIVFITMFFGKKKTVSFDTSDENESVFKFSNKDLSKIDEKLKKYFNDNISLPLIDGVSLSTASGKYTALGNLFLSYGDEKILRLQDFEKQCPEEYEKIFNLLVKFSKTKDTIKKTETKKETKTISKAEDFINKINDLNDAIPHEEISSGLDQTASLLKQISLSKTDDSKLTKLYEYYLPTLITILNKYRELNDSPIHGEEFVECENQLMKTIILINQALKTIYGSIHEYEYMDLNADISTLQSILKKDGLLDDNPFEAKDNGK